MSRQASAWQQLPAVPRVADTPRLRPKLDRCLMSSQLMRTGACRKASLWAWFVRAPARPPHLSRCPLLRNRRRASHWVWSEWQATCGPPPPCTAPTSGHLRRCCRVSGWVASVERCRQERMPLCCALPRRCHVLCWLTVPYASQPAPFPALPTLPVSRRLAARGRGGFPAPAGCGTPADARAGAGAAAAGGLFHRHVR